MVYRAGTWGVFVLVHTSLSDMSLVVFGLVICTLPFGAFALTTKLSCNLVGPWCHCWPWALFVPFGLLSIYCAVEGFILFWNRDEVRASRAAMLTRIILIGTLALAPVLLARRGGSAQHRPDGIVQH